MTASDTVSVDNKTRKEPNALWLTLSYCFNRTWSYTFFFSAVLFSCFGAGQASPVMAELFRSSLLFHAVCLTACGVAHTHVLRLFEFRLFPYVGPALTAVGLIMLFPCLKAGTSPELPIMLTSSFLTGLGSCLTVLLVGKRFVGVSVKSCTVDLLAAAVASAFLSIVIATLPFEVAMAAIIVVPFLSVFFAQKVEAVPENDATPLPSLGERISSGMLARIVVCALIVGVITGILRDLYSAGSGNFDLLSQAILGIVISVLCVVAYVLVRNGKASCIDELYKLAVLVCIVGFAIVPLSGTDVSLPFVFVSAGYSLFEFMLWTLFCEISNRYQYTSIQVFGYGRALTNLVGVISGQIVVLMLSNISLSSELLPALSAGSIILIAIMRTYILCSSDIIAFERTLSGDEENTQDSQTLVEPVDANSENSSKKVPFQKKCLIIGEYYNLTKRETDVFRLLAAGRNSTRIQEELCISSGTVNTHSYHVFQKLGVHRQQEVIDLLENADIDSIQAELAKR